MKLVLLFFVVFLCKDQVFGQGNVWLSTGDSLKRLSREPDLLGRPSPVGGFTIDVNRGQQFQSIKGFGAALSNAAASLLWYSSERQQILQGLFSRTSGIGLSYVRLVMGGSDFNAVSPYTYDDANYEDFNFVEFSIDKDRQFVIPVLREILAINPEVKIMASPWTAPAWMKESNTMYGGYLKSGGTYHGAIADYFIRFIRAYQAEGITIDTLTLQNEPEHDTPGYPTMRMPWDVQRDIIRWHLGPRFRNEGINTEIIIWDHNWDGAWYPLNILNDPEAKQYIAGSGWHCYGGNRYDPLTVVNAHPDKDLYFTECSGGKWDEHFGSVLGWNVQNLFIGQTRIGSRTVLLWNLALDEFNGPIVGADGCTDCRGVVTVYGGGRTHDKNVEYYTLGHFSQFVRPGARRIASSTYEGDELESVAFQNPDGTVAVIVANLAWGATTKTFQIVLDGVWYYYENLPSRSVITFYKT